MYAIAEKSMFIRARIELPPGLNPVTEAFREGWKFVGNKDARLLEKKILSRGWNYIRIVDGWTRSGVGETLQAAICNALNLALRQFSPHFNAAEVNHIEWTEYPWFFLARVMVNPYRIQEGSTIPVLDGALPLGATTRPRLLPLKAAAFFPDFSTAMPMLKEMLVRSRSSQTRVQ
ncbi:MAG: hypothetical protein WA802_14840 [Terracidiphilus sp.]